MMRKAVLGKGFFAIPRISLVTLLILAISIWPFCDSSFRSARTPLSNPVNCLKQIYNTKINFQLNRIPTDSFLASSLLLAVVSIASYPVPAAHAAAAKVLPYGDISRLKYGLKEVDYLVKNWDEKTTYCNFGEFQRELLSVENKQLLMKKAAETGLLDYDKSATMNVMCRKDPQVVRGFLGLTADNTLLTKADSLLRDPKTLQRVDPELVDSYIEAVETFTNALSAADSLSYEARTDFASQQTDFKQAVMSNALSPVNGRKDYLSQTRENVVIVRDSLSLIVSILGL